jgi:Zn-dependent alcohol dehydrogenase
MKIKPDGTHVWSQFFGQSSFAQYSTANKSTIVNVKSLIRDLDELKLFAPLGCGFQTGMGAIQNIAQAGPNDVVLISGLGAVGMGALMVSHSQSFERAHILTVDTV